MGLKFRRGTTAQKSGSLAFGEPYVNTTLGTLQIGGETGDITLGSTGTGSTGNFGAISGSGLDITGNANIAGNLTLGGAITIGDATTDTVNVVASLSSSLIPSVTNAFDLGSETKIWRDLYISTGSIKFIDNGNVVGTLSTTATGLNFGSNITIGSGSFEIGRRGTTYKNTNLIMGVGVMSTDTVTGQHNIGMGEEAGLSLNSGNYNIMLGYQAGRQISNAVSNVLVGQGAGNTLLTYNSIVPSFNTFIGGNAGQFMWTGQKNVALGTAALYGQIGGINTLQNNTAIGYGTATNITGVSTNNIYIGAYAGPSSSFTTETYKFYVSNGDQSQQPYMFGNMTNASRSLDINSSLRVSGSLVVSGSTRITNGLIIGTTGSVQSLVSYPNALTINGNTAGTYGGGIFLARASAHQWGIISDDTDDLIISNNNSFSTRKVKIYDSADKIEFTYSGSETDFGAGFHNIRFDANGIIPAQTNQYDLGSATNIWRDLYISQNSIKIVDTTGSIISTISTNANGSQNFTNGIIVTGSIVGSIAATNGVVSGSSQITISSTTGYDSVLTTSSFNSYTHSLFEQDIYVATSGSFPITVGKGGGFRGQNTALGNTALTSNTTGNYNTMIGSSAGTFNSTGINNTGVGYAAGYINQTGSNNTSVGHIALFDNDGTGNSAFGAGGLKRIKTGSNNIAVGYLAGQYAISGSSNNTFIGYQSGPTSSVVVNDELYIGNSGEASLIRGNFANAALRINGRMEVRDNLVVSGSITATGDVIAYSTSDKRHKNNIVLISDALSKVTKLNGVTWEWNDGVDAATKETPKTGLIAQEVQEVLPEVVKEREDGFLALDYSKMMGLMVEAIKEQQKQIDSLLIKINQLENK